MSIHITSIPNKRAISQLQKMKQMGQKISMITCYDYSFARLINQSAMDLILVGDSGVMTQLGYPDTTHATIELMSIMTQAVAKGAPDKLLIADMPFLSHRQGIQHATQCADNLIKSGAQAIKIEGVMGHEEVIEHLTQSGIPVMGHLGLTPQSVHSMGYKVQGKDQAQAKLIKNQALQLQSLGCFAIVLECVPDALAKEITQSLLIPVIGIGAGANVDGQVLVLQDLLGLNDELKPKFARQFIKADQAIKEAINSYHNAVANCSFPNEQETYFTTKNTNRSKDLEHS